MYVIFKKSFNVLIMNSNKFIRIHNIKPLSDIFKLKILELCVRIFNNFKNYLHILYYIMT